MHQFDKPRQILAVGLAGLAGFVDAIGFLANGGYFTSFMSGNTTRLAVDLVRSPWVAAMPALIILCFLAGVIGGAIVAARMGAWRKPAVLGLVAVLVTGGALLGMARLKGPELAAMVMAMGALNNSFQRDGEVAVGLTYMTGALVKLGQGLAARAMGRKASGWQGYLALWCGLATGALGGAAAYVGWGHGAEWIAAGWSVAMAFAAFGLTRSELRDRAASIGNGE